MIWPDAVAFVNGRVLTDDGIAGSIRCTSRILSIDEQPRRGDTVIDLDGAFVLPGLVNAHDHLELNHFGRLTGRDRYQNVSEWIDDIRPRLTGDPAIRAGRACPLVERVFHGALKNLLAGVTLVAHHNPFYRELRRAIPIRVLRRYGWAHSFALEGQPAGARGESGGEVAQRWRATPPSVPFFVHLAEGVDTTAAGELARLESLGCLAANTVLVHGVAIDADGCRRVVAAGAGLSVVPGIEPLSVRPNGGRRRAATVAERADGRYRARNRFADHRRARPARRAARGARERVALVVGSPRHGHTRRGGSRQTSRSGRIAAGLPADIIIIPPLAGTAADSLLETRRRDVRLVMIDGRPLVADRVFGTRIFRARRAPARGLSVDGVEKLAAAGLTRRIEASPIPEPGVSVP